MWEGSLVSHTLHSERKGLVTLQPLSCRLVSQATPFAERGRVWSRCNYRVVAEERNYQTWRLSNKMLTSAKLVT